jgi:hypothetical protein
VVSQLENWDLEEMLERMQMVILRDRPIDDTFEKDKKRIKYIKDLASIISKYIEIKENM